MEKDQIFVKLKNLMLNHPKSRTFVFSIISNGDVATNRKHVGYAQQEGFLAGSMVKNLPAMRETWIQSLGWKDPLEKGIATHSNILAWRFPWTEEPGGLQSLKSQRVRHDKHTCTN